MAKIITEIPSISNIGVPEAPIDGIQYGREDATWTPINNISYTDEQAQDAIGTILLDTVTIDLSYNDVIPSISADVKPNSIDSSHLSNSINVSEFVNDSDYATEAYVDSKIPSNYSKVVYVDSNNPNTATIFDVNNPPTVNDDTLKTDVNNLYVGLNASTWVYNSTSLTYITEPITSGTSNFYLGGTLIDAGGNKTAAIERTGPVGVGTAIASNHAVTKAQHDTKGDMTTNTNQTVSGVKTFLAGMFGLRNTANTFTSFFASAVTASRTWTWPDKNGTVAMTSDIKGTYVAFLKGTGNDSTGVIGNILSPFLTLEGLISSVITTNGSMDNCQIVVLDNGTYSTTTIRTISDLNIVCNTSAIIKITEQLTITNLLNIVGSFEFNLDLKTGSTSQYVIFSTVAKTVNINVAKWTHANTFVTPIIAHIRIQTNVVLLRFYIGELVNPSRFVTDAWTKKDIFIDKCTGILPEFNVAPTASDCAIYVKNITYTGTGTLDPFASQTANSNKVVINSTTCTSTGTISLSFVNRIIELTGGIFENTIFIASGVSSNKQNMLTGFGTITFKKSYANSTVGIISVSQGGARSNSVMMNFLKNLNLIITDTSSGTFLANTPVIAAWGGAGSPSSKIILENVNITVPVANCPLFMVGIQGGTETADQYVGIMKGYLNFIGSGYFAVHRTDDGLTFAGYKVFAKIGNCISHIGGTGYTSDATNISVNPFDITSY